MTRAAVYVRVSSDRQTDGTSPDEQRRILTELAQRNGWEFDVYEEVGSAGHGAFALPVLSQVLGRIALGDYQKLLAMRLDRLSRGGVGDGERLKRSLMQSGCEIVTPGGNFDPRNDADDTTSDFHWLVAKIDNKLRAFNTHRGADARARAGQRVGAKTASGYLVVYNPDGSTRVEVDEPMAAAIRRAYELFVSGVGGCVTVARMLNDEGHRAKDGRPLHKQTVAQWLKNPRYAGWEFRRAPHTTHRYRANRRKYVTAMDTIMVKSEVWPVIIPQELFDQAQAIWQRRGETVTRPARTPLAGLLRCPGCGGQMRMGSANNNSKHVYRCSTKHDGKFACSQGNIRAEDAYALAWDAVRRILEGRWPKAKTTTPAGRKVADIQRDIGRNQRQTDTLVARTLDGTFTAEQARPKSEQLRTERARLERELAQAKRPAPATGPQRIPPAVLATIRPAADDPAFHELMQGLVRSIELAANGVLPVRSVDSWGRKRWRAKRQYVVQRVILLDGSTYTRES